MFVGRSEEERALASEECGLWKQSQKKFGHPWGQCVRASYASLLEIPIEQVPDFSPGKVGSGRQLEAEKKWLASLGLRLVIVKKEPGKPLPKVPDNVYHLISARSLNSFPEPHGHRVVGRGGKVIFDPHPGGPGISEIKAFYFVVPDR